MKIVKASRAKVVRVLYYVLIDPRTGIARYAGQTCKTAKARLKLHCDGARPNSKRKLYRWIVELREVGLKPTMQVIANLECFSGNQTWDRKIMNGAERGIIKHLEKMPNNLNGTHTTHSPAHNESIRLGVLAATKRRAETIREI